VLEMKWQEEEEEEEEKSGEFLLGMAVAGAVTAEPAVAVFC